MSNQITWKTAEEAANALRDPQIAAVLTEVKKVDASVISDDHAAFAAALADDLAVNNPLNSISTRTFTQQLNGSGRISYSRVERRIEYAGVRGDLVILMGEEIVVPKGSNPNAGREVRRRFTDVWKPQDGRWVLTARQATIIGIREL